MSWFLHITLFYVIKNIMCKLFLLVQSTGNTYWCNYIPLVLFFEAKICFSVLFLTWKCIFIFQIMNACHGLHGNDWRINSSTHDICLECFCKFIESTNTSSKTYGCYCLLKLRLTIMLAQQAKRLLFAVGS